MSPTDSQVLADLVSIYENQGISTDKLLNTEFFKSLPTEAKIEALKTYAERLSRGVRFDKKDLAKGLLAVGGLAAVAAGTHFLLRPGLANVKQTVNDEFANRVAGKILEVNDKNRREGREFTDYANDREKFFKEVNDITGEYSTFQKARLTPAAWGPIYALAGQAITTAAPLAGSAAFAKSLISKYKDKALLTEMANDPNIIQNRILKRVKDASLPR